jgi:hypothetical protein
MPIEGLRRLCTRMLCWHCCIFGCFSITLSALATFKVDQVPIVPEIGEGDPTWSCAVYPSFVQLFGTCNSCVS